VRRIHVTRLRGSYPRAHVLDSYAKRAQDASCEAFFKAKHPEQQMLTADLPMSQTSGFILRAHDNLPAALSETLEHALTLSRTRLSPPPRDV
jgi:hypothetical protein